MLGIVTGHAWRVAGNFSLCENMRLFSNKLLGFKHIRPTNVTSGESLYFELSAEKNP